MRGPPCFTAAVHLLDLLSPNQHRENMRHFLVPMPLYGTKRLSLFDWKGNGGRGSRTALADRGIPTLLSQVSNLIQPWGFCMFDLKDVWFLCDNKFSLERWDLKENMCMMFDSPVWLGIRKCQQCAKNKSRGTSCEQMRSVRWSLWAIWIMKEDGSKVKMCNHLFILCFFFFLCNYEDTPTVLWELFFHHSRLETDD